MVIIITNFYNYSEIITIQLTSYLNLKPVICPLIRFWFTALLAGALFLINSFVFSIDLCL